MPPRAIKPGRKRTVTTNAAGRELLEAVRELRHAVVTGDYSKLTIREVAIPEPEAYRPDDIRRLRELLGVSQALFGRLLGVSPELVAHWEYGVRIPSPLARRLLDRVRMNPPEYLASLIRRRQVSSVAARR